MRWRALAASLLGLLCVVRPAGAATSPADVRIAFVPLDDRPATQDFPRAVAAICGARLDLPPQPALGHFTTPGDPEAIAHWLDGLDPTATTALVVSTDMLAYGGLVASRTPATSFGVAMDRLLALEAFHQRWPGIPIYAFGTAMRLAPTATPQSAPYLDALTHYAQNAGADAPSPSLLADIALSRSHIPDGIFWDYIGSRARDLKIDERLLAMAARGDFAALALTQDDAGAADGLQNGDERALHAMRAQLGLTRRVLLNPGTDEMGMVMVARAIEDAAGYAPSVAISYASSDAPATQDPLEYVPIGATIDALADFLKMARRDAGDFELDVVTPQSTPDALDAQLARVEARLRAGAPTAITDLTFLGGDDAQQRRMVESLEADGVADKPIAYASWNTTANTVGTALAVAAVTEAGRRAGTLDADAVASFLFERYVDDYGYRLLVRPALQAQLSAEGIDRTMLGPQAADTESAAREMLWPDAIDLFDRGFRPDGYVLDEIGIHLPWQRTFEVRIDSRVTRYASGSGLSAR